MVRKLFCRELVESSRTAAARCLQPFFDKEKRFIAGCLILRISLDGVLALQHEANKLNFRFCEEGIMVMNLIC